MNSGYVIGGKKNPTHTKKFCLLIKQNSYGSGGSSIVGHNPSGDELWPLIRYYITSLPGLNFQGVMGVTVGWFTGSLVKIRVKLHP